MGLRYGKNMVFLIRFKKFIFVAPAHSQGLKYDMQTKTGAECSNGFYFFNTHLIQRNSVIKGKSQNPNGDLWLKVKNLALETFYKTGYMGLYMKNKKTTKIFISVCLLLSVCFVVSCECQKQSYSLDLRNRIKHITLKNGLKVLLLKRVGAPVFTAQIKVKVGNIEEEAGYYGLAHFFEHLAFKGTETIGTKNYVKEKQILDEIFKIGTQIVELKKKGESDKQVSELLKKRKALEAEHKKQVVDNEFMSVYQRNGAVDLNATTSNDFTTYYVSLPANKLELWAYLESSRFKRPVMRDFFTEVNVVAEERRSRIENSPVGRLYEAYADLAFDKSPYKIMVIGPADNIQNYVPKVARSFYERFYVPSRIVIAIVGNIDFEETERVIRKYFEDIPQGKDSSETFRKEKFDVKTFPRERIITGPEKPRFYLGYHRPAHPHPDDIVLDVVKDIMCSGRTSRLFKKLVLETKKASFVGCYASVPGMRLDGLFTFYALPHVGYSNKDLKNEIKAEIDLLAKEGPTQHELQKVKNKIDADLIYSLQSNAGLASQLAFYESLAGNWEYIYELQETIHKITAEDVKRVIKAYFNKDKEVTVYFEQKKS